MAISVPPNPPAGPEEKRLPSGAIRRRGLIPKPEKEADLSATDLYLGYMRLTHPMGFGKKQRERLDSGHSFEVAVLGEPLSDEINEEALRRKIAYFRENNSDTKKISVRGIHIGVKRIFIPDKEAKDECFELVKEMQGGNVDPENPTRELPRNLRLALMKELGIPNEESHRVKFYSGVGTMLDYTPGINADAFFEIDGVEITIDITIRDTKEAWESGADLVVGRDDLIAIDSLVKAGTEYSEEHELARASFLEQVDKMAKTLIDKFNRKQKENR